MGFWPTMQIHATTYRLITRFRDTPKGVEFKLGADPQQADSALAGGSVLMAMLVEYQSRFFELGLEKELLAFRADYTQARNTATSPSP